MSGSPINHKHDMLPEVDYRDIARIHGRMNDISVSIHSLKMDLDALKAIVQRHEYQLKLLEQQNG